MIKKQYEIAMWPFTHISMLLYLLLEANANSNLIKFIYEYLLDNPLFIICNFEKTPMQEALEEVLKIEHPKILTNAEEPVTTVNNKHVDVAVNYIIIAYNVREASHLCNKLSKSGKWNSKMKHLLLFTSSQLGSGTVTAAFKMMWKYRVFNTVLMPLTSKDSFDGFTWYPYLKQSKCGNVVIPTKLNSSSNPFANKIPNKFDGCVVKAIWNKLPFTKNNPLSKTNPGALVELLNTICYTMGLKMAFANSSQDLVYTEYLSKVKMTKVTKIMVDENVDVICSLFGPSVFELLDEKLSLSSYVMSFESFWLLPFAKPRPMWQVLLETLHYKHVVCLVFAYLFSVTVWRVCSFDITESAPRSFWNITKRTLLHRSVTNTSSPTKKIALFLMLWVTINSYNIYNTRLISLVTTPAFPATPKTLRDLIDTKHNFVYQDYMNLVLRSRSVQLAEDMLKRRVEGVIPASPLLVKDLLSNLSSVVQIDTFVLSWLKNPECLEILQETVRFLKQVHSKNIFLH